MVEGDIEDSSQVSSMTSLVAESFDETSSGVTSAQKDEEFGDTPPTDARTQRVSLSLKKTSRQLSYTGLTTMKVNLQLPRFFLSIIVNCKIAI